MTPRSLNPDGRNAPLLPGSDLREPNLVALYGANDSGKTNVLCALEFFAILARDENYYRKYLSSSYGGVPHIG